MDLLAFDRAQTKMLTIRGGYHGDRFSCMSVCDLAAITAGMVAAVKEVHG